MQPLAKITNNLESALSKKPDCRLNMVLPAVALITIAFIVSSTASTAQLRDSDPIVDHPWPGNLSFMLGTWTESDGARREIWTGDNIHGIYRIREWLKGNSLSSVQITTFAGRKYGTSVSSEEPQVSPPDSLPSQSDGISFGTDSVKIKYKTMEERYDLSNNRLTLIRTDQHGSKSRIVYDKAVTDSADVYDERVPKEEPTR